MEVPQVGPCGLSTVTCCSAGGRHTGLTRPPCSPLLPQPVLHIPVPHSHCHRLAPFHRPTPVVKRLWEEGQRLERLPRGGDEFDAPSRNKILLKNKIKGSSYSATSRVGRQAFLHLHVARSLFSCSVLPPPQSLTITNNPPFCCCFPFRCHLFNVSAIQTPNKHALESPQHHLSPPKQTAT